MKAVYLIPARAGSKGLPGKNIRALGGKPLIEYSIDFALRCAGPESICISSDSPEVLEAGRRRGLLHLIDRPAELASDTAGSREVMLHALQWLDEHGSSFDTLVLLQPTSPFRKISDMHAMIERYDSDTQMVVSVRESHDNPYFNLFEEDPDGFLKKSKTGTFTRRQDCPKTYAYNGSIYIIRRSSLEASPLAEFTHVKKQVMDDMHSVDIDNLYDWYIAEMLLEKKLVDPSADIR